MVTVDALQANANDAMRQDFESATGVSPRANINGAQCTTFAIGGMLPYFAEPSNEEELRSVLGYLSQGKFNARVIGAGSNLLIPTVGLSEWVLRLGRGFRELRKLGQGRFRVGAGFSLMTLSRELSEAGLSGLEFAGGIPATIGGAVRMNAGAHGGEFSSVLESINALDQDGNAHMFEARELQFDYRHCALSSEMIIVSATIKLLESDAERTSRRRAECLAERKRRQPLTLPSAGSVFRNPSKDCSAGALIERAGLKGFKVGGAEISALHGNWIVNPQRSATDKDVLEIITHCQANVFRGFGVRLIPEIVCW